MSLRQSRRMCQVYCLLFIIGNWNYKLYCRTSNGKYVQFTLNRLLMIPPHQSEFLLMNKLKY